MWYTYVSDSHGDAAPQVLFFGYIPRHVGARMPRQGPRQAPGQPSWHVAPRPATTHSTPQHTTIIHTVSPAKRCKGIAAASSGTRTAASVARKTRQVPRLILRHAPQTHATLAAGVATVCVATTAAGSAAVLVEISLRLGWRANRTILV